MAASRRAPSRGNRVAALEVGGSRVSSLAQVKCRVLLGLAVFLYAHTRNRPFASAVSALTHINEERPSARAKTYRLVARLVVDVHERAVYLREFLELVLEGLAPGAVAKT